MTLNQITFFSIVAGISSLRTLVSQRVSMRNTRIHITSSFFKALRVRAGLGTEIRFHWIKSISQSAIVGKSTPGVNLAVSWPTPPLGPLTTLPRRFSAGRDIHSAAIGGQWAQSCSNALSAGLHSVQTIPMIPIKKSWIGPIL